MVYVHNLHNICAHQICLLSSVITCKDQLIWKKIMFHLGGGSARSQIMQLIGAVAMLVLLGVPWIFSVWGAVEDERLSTVEGIFQVDVYFVWPL